MGGWASGKRRLTGGKKSQGGKIQQKGILKFQVTMGAHEGATKEEPALKKSFTLETGIPERAWGKVNLKPATVGGVYTGGLDKKGREIVYVVDFKFNSEFDIECSVKRRVYANSSSQDPTWKSELVLAGQVMIPKEVVEEESESDSDAAGGLLGSDSDSDSESDS